MMSPGHITSAQYVATNFHHTHHIATHRNTHAWSQGRHLAACRVIIMILWYFAGDDDR